MLSQSSLTTPNDLRAVRLPIGRDNSLWQLTIPSLPSDTKFGSQSGNAVKLGHSAIAISYKVVADR